jgi:hypothetical protein
MTDMADVRFAVLNQLMSRRQQVESALNHQDGEGFTFAHVFDRVARGEALFFWNDSSCAVMEVRSFPGGNMLHIFLAAGTTDGLLELYTGVAEWGKRELNCTRMTTLCRKGFRRRLAKHGWRENQVWLVKEI